ALGKFAGMAQNALVAYAQANNGQVPASLSQLQAYFAPPVDDSVLQRYELNQSGMVVAKTTLQSDPNDEYYEISANTINGRTGNEIALEPPMQAYSAANNGQTPTDPSQLLPYVHTPAEQNALQQLMHNTPAK